MTKTVQAQYMNFNRLARLWNKLPQHIRMSDSSSSFKRQSLYMGYYLLLLWVWCTIILGLRNICSTGTLISPQPLLSELRGESFTLRFQKLDSEVDGWFWCPYLGVGSRRTTTVSDFFQRLDSEVDGCFWCYVYIFSVARRLYELTPADGF